MRDTLRPTVFFLLLSAAVGFGYLAGDARSEDDKSKSKKPFVQIASGKAKLKKGSKHAIEVKLGKDIACVLRALLELRLAAGEAQEGLEARNRGQARQGHRLRASSPS